MIFRQGHRPGLADSHFRDLQALGQGSKSAKEGWSFADDIKSAGELASYTDTKALWDKWPRVRPG